MRFTDWEPVYTRILADMGYDRDGDESAVRILKAVTVNCDLIDPDDIKERFGSECTVFGDASCLEDDLARSRPIGTLVASGSSVGRLLAAGILPDIVVTDLDGDMEPQIDASSRGAISFIHAHGDNADAIREWAWRFEGPVVLTTQSRPESTVFDFGGFTDGDRAVCIAQEMGVRKVHLMGFDFDHPRPKNGSDPAVKLRKLGWAKEIVSSLTGIDVLMSDGTALTLHRSPSFSAEPFIEVGHPQDRRYR